jgi:hypothetical protein
MTDADAGRAMPSTERSECSQESDASIILAHWSTPTAVEQSEDPDTKDARNERHRAAGKMKGVGGYKLSTQVRLATQRVDSGRTVIGSGTATESTGLLNREHSRWLQGYPETWTRYAPSATASSRKSPRSLSRRTRTPGETQTR